MKWIYGWLYGGTTNRMQYVRKPYVSNGVKWEWGLTEEIRQARKFRSKQECIDHWRSICAFPDKYDHCINDGYLHFMNDKGQIQLF